MTSHQRSFLSDRISLWISQNILSLVSCRYRHFRHLTHRFIPVVLSQLKKRKNKYLWKIFPLGDLLRKKDIFVPKFKPQKHKKLSFRFNWNLSKKSHGDIKIFETIFVNTGNVSCSVCVDETLNIRLKLLPSFDKSWNVFFLICLHETARYW